MLRIALIDRIDITSFPGYFFGELDALKSKNVKSFLHEMKRIFKFPDYFGFNYNALDEYLNDLDWIENDNYILYIKNYDHFLSEEKRIDLIDTLKLLNDTANEWANVPNFEGEDEFRKKADFRLFIEKTKMSSQDIKVIE